MSSIKIIMLSSAATALLMGQPTEGAGCEYWCSDFTIGNYFCLDCGAAEEPVQTPLLTVEENTVNEQGGVTDYLGCILSGETNCVSAGVEGIVSNSLNIAGVQSWENRVSYDVKRLLQSVNRPYLSRSWVSREAKRFATDYKQFLADMNNNLGALVAEDADFSIQAAVTASLELAGVTYNDEMSAAILGLVTVAEVGDIDLIVEQSLALAGLQVKQTAITELSSSIEEIVEAASGDSIKDIVGASLSVAEIYSPVLAAVTNEALSEADPEAVVRASLVAAGVEQTVDTATSDVLAIIDAVSERRWWKRDISSIVENSFELAGIEVDWYKYECSPCSSYAWQTDTDMLVCQNSISNSCYAAARCNLNIEALTICKNPQVQLLTSTAVEPESAGVDGGSLALGVGIGAAAIGVMGAAFYAGKKAANKGEDGLELFRAGDV